MLTDTLNPQKTQLFEIMENLESELLVFWDILIAAEFTCRKTENFNEKPWANIANQLKLNNLGVSQFPDEPIELGNLLSKHGLSSQDFFEIFHAAWRSVVGEVGYNKSAWQDVAGQLREIGFSF